jgi:hypothetical protein
MHDTEGETIDDVRRQRDEAIDEMEAVAERWEDRYCKMCIEVNAAEARTDALGIQLAALRERLRLAMAVVEASRAYRDEDEVYLDRALAAFDAVPGDTLERP